MEAPGLPVSTECGYSYFLCVPEGEGKRCPHQRRWEEGGRQTDHSFRKPNGRKMGIGECLPLLKATLVACYFLVTTSGSVVKKVGQCLLSIFDINSMESADPLLKESEEVSLPGSCWFSAIS